MTEKTADVKSEAYSDVQCDVMTFPPCLERVKKAGYPVSEYALRQWLKRGLIPCRFIGRKVLVSYSAVIRFLECADGGDVRPAVEPGRVQLRVIGR